MQNWQGSGWNNGWLRAGNPLAVQFGRGGKKLVELLKRGDRSAMGSIREGVSNIRLISNSASSHRLILISHYQFSQFVVIKSEEITNISSKFNKNTVQSANPLDLILKIT